MNSKDIIYHYTSLDALINILKPDRNEKIYFWASHAEFLNDPLEYKFALSLLKPSLEKYERENSKHEELSKTLPANFGIRLLELAPGEPFLLSLSELPDDLSMWRAYGANGSGVSIGLDKNMLEKLGGGGNCNFLKCSYIEEENIVEMSNFWNSIYDALPDFIKEGSIDGKYALNFFKILSHCFRLKNKSYSSEIEWRFCRYEWKENINYRMKNGLVVPYSKLPFDKNIIREIWIGPSAKADLSKKAIKMALKTYSYNVDQNFVQISTVPYRSL